MSLTRQGLILIVVQLMAVNQADASDQADAGDQGVRHVVVDEHLKVVELPIQVNRLTTFVFDTEVKHVFSPEKDMVKVEILEDLGLHHLDHSPVMLKVADGVRAGRRTNLVIMTERYILSVRVRITGESQPGYDLVDFRTDYSSPAFAKSQSKPPASGIEQRMEKSSDTAELPAGAHVEATAERPRDLAASNAGGSVRITQIHRSHGDAYVAFQLERPGNRTIDATVQLTDLRGRRIASRVYWEASSDSTDSSTQSATKYQGLLRVANADKLRGQPLALTIGVPDSSWRVRVEGIRW